MKKQTTTLLILAAAGAAAYYFMKNKGASTDKTALLDEPQETGTGTDDVNAVVTAAPGQIQAAVEKATEIAANVKDAVVAVTDGTQTALVTSGKSKREAKRLERQAKLAARKSARKTRIEERRAARKARKAGKWTTEQLEQYCTNKGLEQGTRQFKKCVRQSRKLKSIPFVEKTQ